jgi:hypothetical protein
LLDDLIFCCLFIIIATSFSSFMKRFSFLLTTSLVITLLIYSCTSTVTDIQLTSTERIVVSGLLIADSPLRNIQISRTLPPLDTFTVDRVFLGDAKASITVDGQTIALRLQAQTPADTLPNGKPAPRRSFYEAPGLTVQAGKTYTLRVEWQGKVATAETIVPAAPIVEQSRLTFSRTSEFTTNASIFLTGDTTRLLPRGGMIAVVPATTAVVTLNVRARSTEMYRVFSFIVRDAQTRDSLGGDAALGVQNAQSGASASSGTVTLRQTISLVRRFPPANFILPARIFPPTASGSVIVQAADSAYYDYVISNARANSGNNPIGAEGINPRWNVKGDGIGLFIGTSQTRLTVRP